MNSPTLIVGLGGVGSEIVQKVYERATPTQKKKLSFVVFDTDVNELRTIEERTPEIRVIQTSTRLTVGEYLDVDHFARDTWFPVNKILNGKMLTEGAGQVRAISRLALDTVIQQGKLEPLNSAIEELYKLTGEKLELAPRVIVTGSLCGGTGSGLILPICLYIRNYMIGKLQHGTCSIRGFFLLPEVFESVIKTQSEKNNQRSNAYAAVREISAFMRKDAGGLSSKNTPHFYAPRPGSGELDEYLGLPMDFCFLFDAQNLDGGKLSSFQDYKDHAADCIYGMAIAPTSKRSNSSEDNVIKEIVLSGGNKRFAGAGTSMLIYPTEDVEEYLALNWVKTSITNEWLKIDRRYYSELDSVKRRRQQGIQAADIDRGDHYVRIVNEGETDEDSFRRAIHSLCMEYKINGITEDEEKAEKYIRELSNYIDKSVDKALEDYKDIRDTIASCQIAASTAKQEEMVSKYEELYDNIQGYRNAVKSASRNMADNISYQLFMDPSDYSETDSTFRMEYWMRNKRNEGDFLHPSAIRYFLYSAMKKMKDSMAVLHGSKQEIQDRWNEFEKDTFDNEETEGYYETPGEYFDNNHFNDKETIQKMLHNKEFKAAVANLDTAFNTLYGSIDEYWRVSAKEYVMQAGIEYLKSINKAFEEFFDVLDRNVPQLDKRMTKIEQKYTYESGKALRYVCANETCLKGMAEDVKNPNSSLSMPSELNRNIYRAMRDYAVAERKPDEQYFREVFQKNVVNFLQEEIRKSYGNIVHMDILSAIDREAYYLGETEDRQRELYAKHLLETARRLSRPFIEGPVGKEPRVIPACAYSAKLMDDTIAGREDFINKYLKDDGGEADDSIDTNMILYYSAIYMLEPSDLSKFSPPRVKETFTRDAGDYYKAYYELIKDLNPDTTRSRVITPHIDRWWHIITKMPDLDPWSDDKQERELFEAFFWGIVGGYVKYREENEKTFVYYVNNTFLNKKKSDSTDVLMVSNGTPCDHLYEVLDAFAINPGLVNSVLNNVNARINNDLYNKKDLDHSLLMEKLKFFTVTESILKNDEPGRLHSVLDIPMMMKWSVPPEEYYEESTEGLLVTILEVIKKNISRYCEDKEINKVYGHFLSDQFELFMENMRKAHEVLPKVYQDALFNEIVDRVHMELLDAGLDEEAMSIYQKVNELKIEA